MVRLIIMDTKKNQKLIDEIEYIAMEVSSLIKVTRDSCEYNDLIEQQMPLDLAYKKQEKLLEKFTNIIYS